MQKNRLDLATIVVALGSSISIHPPHQGLNSEDNWTRPFWKRKRTHQSNNRDHLTRTHAEVTQLLIKANEKRERKNVKRLFDFRQCEKGNYKNV